MVTRDQAPSKKILAALQMLGGRSHGGGYGWQMGSVLMRIVAS